MNDKASQWREAMARLDDLLGLPESEHERYLKDLSVTQPEIHAQLLTLLKADQAAAHQSFLEPTPLHENSSNAFLLNAGAKLGHYQIISPLGRGGMGEVWLAKRDDGLYEGEVAIKILHPQFGSTALRDRFRREAHLLGRLTHPHISRLLDAGIVDDIVYLVLEYVDGKPIDTWCDQQQLKTRDRLSLFISLCEAVAHAHSNLVVHRDIKPANVLVNNEGGVKLLDFGIGKLVERENALDGTTTHSELTQISGRLFTPEYAAPEQITGEPITTATDVFALGSLLYFILCGTRPFSGSNTSATEYAVLHSDPPSLSQAARDASAETLTARATTAQRLQRKLAGDLEHIVNRAIRKQPSQRYTSVAALIEDLQRYLSHQPVLARTGSRSYLMRRFMQRHRLAVVAVAGIVLSLIVGATGIVWNANAAREQARIATLESNKAKAVKEFLLSIFKSNSEDHPDGARARQTTAEELLDIATDKVLASDSQDLELQAELLHTLGELNQRLEKYSRSEALERKHLQLLQQQLGKSHPRTLETQLNLAIALLHREQYPELKSMVDDVLATLDAKGISVSLERGRAESLLGEHAYMLANPGDPAPVDHFRAAIKILEQLSPSEQLVDAQLALGRALNFFPNPTEAAAAGLRGIEIATAFHGPRNTFVADGHTTVSEALTKLEQFDKAEQHAKQSIELNSYALGPDSAATLWSRMALSNLLIAKGLHRQASQEIESALAAHLKSGNSHLIPTQYVRHSLSQTLQAIGDFKRARTLLETALAAPGLTADPHLMTLINFQAASLELELSHATTARGFSERGLALFDPDAAFLDSSQIQLLLVHAEILAALGKQAESNKTMTGAIHNLHTQGSQSSKQNSDRPLQLSQQLAQISIDIQQRHFDSAVTRSQSLLTELNAATDPQRWWLQTETAYRYLATAQRALGNLHANCQSLDKAIALRQANALATDPRLLQSRRLRSQCR